MAYDLTTNEPQTRTITGLDDEPYALTMEGWYWNALDWLDAETNWKFSDLLDIAWTSSINVIRNQTTTNPGNFLADLTLALKYAIKLRIEECERAEDAEINETDHAVEAASTTTIISSDQVGNYDPRPIKRISLSNETHEITLVMPTEAIANIMSILGTVAATWSTQDETALGHPYDRVKDLADQLQHALT